MDIHQPQPRRKSRARERLNARRNRQFLPVLKPFDANAGGSDKDAEASTAVSQVTASAQNQLKAWGERLADMIPTTIHPPRSFLQSVVNLRARTRAVLKDVWWYTLHRPYVPQAFGALIVTLVVAFIVSHLLTERIFPNVWALGVYIGDLTVEEAEVALANTWENEMEFHLVDGDRSWTATPAELGIELDALTTVEAARGVGLAGIPFGYHVTPQVEIDVFVAQNYLLDMTEIANYAPKNASYQWQGNDLVGVPGEDGRMLDVGMTLEQLKVDLVQVAETGRIDLVMQPLAPEVTDPEPYLTAARELTSQPFELRGYDPYLDQFISWGTDRQTLTSWLEATSDGLGLHAQTFAQFMEAQNATLNNTGETVGVRYLEPTETMEKVQQAIGNGQVIADLRIRYRDETYSVERGDTGYIISRKTGIPFFLIQQANPGIEWDQLSVGTNVRIPSRDVTMPIDPVPNKRIVVNIDTNTMTAFENGSEVFSWRVSSGRGTAPTSPGVYQILTHNEVAAGSSFDLCGATGCGQWQMYWFMGIYEVVPGLMNGFHGAVLLPNGAYLAGGNVGGYDTYGCVMAENSNAENLYRWADQGTVVEIVSNEFRPISELGFAHNQKVFIAHTDIG